MSESKPKRTRQRSEDVADLFRILRFMASDKGVSEPHFRIAFRIAQFAHSGTSVAKVSDETLMNHLPRTDEKKLRLFRRSLEALKWIRTVEGARGRPTRYVFLGTRIPEIQERLATAREKREAEFALRKSQEHSGAKAMALRARIDAETGGIEDGLPGKYAPPNKPAKAGNLRLDKGVILPPLLPKRSTYPTGYRKQGVTQDAPAPLPASAPMPARAYIPPPPAHDEDDTITEIPTAAIQSANSVRCECGNPAVCEIVTQLGGGFVAHCEECAEDVIPFDTRPLELRPINSGSYQPDARMSYAELSRGR